MHMARPKSSKGRNRPVPGCNQTAVGASCHDAPISPRPPSASHEEENCWAHAQPQASSFVRQKSAVSADKVAELLQHVPAPPAVTLNKYRVLPSIDKRRSSGDKPLQGAGEKAVRHSLSNHHSVQSCRGRQGQCISSGQRALPSQSYPEENLALEVPHGTPAESTGLADSASGLVTLSPSPAGDEGRLLLAIRSPSGRRFEQHFNPSDTLWTVLAAAEAQYATKYQGSIIETMDIPRVSFADLTQTLAQCGIQNKSVLCISLEDSNNTDTP